LIRVALVKTWAVITVTTANVSATLLANQIANPDSWKVEGFYAKSDGTEFYVLVSYRT